MILFSIMHLDLHFVASAAYSVDACG